MKKEMPQSRHLSIHKDKQWRTRRDYKVLYEEADYSDQKARAAMIDHVFYDEMMRLKKNKPEFMAYGGL